MHGMQKIEKWEDVKPFAGKIVAYTARSYYFNEGQESSIVTQEEPNLKIGYIIPGTEISPWCTSEYGFNLACLLKKKSISSKHALINSLIKEDGSIYMREVTHEECAKILKLLVENKVKWDYDMGPNEQEINNMLNASSAF